ncbi:MAG: hypothetical protein IJP30_01280 [Clostridia bacterium]|nr:hypothetical protein [Clostridia bacterium]
MNHFWTITAVTLSSAYGTSRLKSLWRGGGKQKLKAVLAVLGVMLLLGGLEGSLGMMFYGLFNSVPMPALRQTLFSAIVMAGMLMVFVFGIFYALGMLYTRDMELLLSMPVKKKTIYAAKLTATLITETAVFALFLLPAYVAYGVIARFTVQYALSVLLILALGPCIPFMLSNLIASLLMSIAAFSRHRERILTIGGFLLMIVYFVSVQLISGGGENQLGALLTGGWIKTVTGLFPPAYWAASALTAAGYKGMMHLMLFVFTAVAAYVLCIVFTGAAFNRMAAHMGDVPKATRKKAGRAVPMRQRRRVQAVFIKEWKTVLRSPVYAMNGLVSVVFAPLLFIMFGVMTMSELDADMIAEMIDLLNIGTMVPYIILLAGGISALMGSINTAGMTVYSREGESVYLLLTLPGAAQAYCMGKLLFSLSVTAAAVLACVPVFVLLYKMPVLLALGIAAFALLVDLPGMLLFTLLDMAYPRLHWDSEQAAIKKNLNAVISMFAGFALLGLLGFGTGYMIYLGVSEWAALGAVALLCAVVSIALFFALRALTDKLTARMGSR